MQKAGAGVALLLNCGESGEAMEADALARKLNSPPTDADLRTYGVGAQILRNLKVSRMKILGHSRRMPSLVGFGLHVVSFVDKPQ